MGKKQSGTITIRPFNENDWGPVWKIIEPVFRAGETYAFSPDITEEESRAAWISAPAATFVALDSDNIIAGTYYIKPNQPALGAHVCNCGYIVSENARGQGIAAMMCEHSLSEALKLGFRAIQFNLVVSTNEHAIRLWKKMGFSLIGTLPGAFRHAEQGFVDAHVMYRELVE